MNKIRYFFKQLKFVKFRDILAVFSFLIALPISWFYRLKRKNLWVVCERANEARDNGFWFYKYMREKQPQQDIVYAIKKKSFDYKKVEELGGEVIEFGSLKHWIYYLTARINISSQKEGKPNAALCHFLEIYGFLKNRRVYLKHGIVANDLKWHYYAVTKMWLYICTVQKELDYCLEKFGYPPNAMVLTGLCRYDNLLSEIQNENMIFIMPTHREWLSRPIKEYKKYDNVFNFTDTEYYKSWRAFLLNEDFNKKIEEKNIEVVFFLHPNMQKYTKHFEGLNKNIRIVCSKDADLQCMMKKAGLMITDYSSVSFDFAYMRKPLLYYQFDYEKFRKGHYQEGYYSYKDDGFGPVCLNSVELSQEVCKILDNNMAIFPQYLDRIEHFFKFHDSENCKRTYEAIIKRLENEEN